MHCSVRTLHELTKVQLGSAAEATRKRARSQVLHTLVTVLSLARSMFPNT